MKTYGIYFLVAGIASFALNQFNYELLIFSWINNWGPEKALGIRVAITAIGIILFIVGKISNKANSGTSQKLRGRKS